MDSTRSDSPQPQYLKLEDLQSAVSPATTAFDSAAAGSQQSPASVVIHSRPAKKRKSWGQELPQPKTNLPPRKRAKTEDEKEQRRIERIKRNRAAAHNSRERKRQETENLAVLLARARAELDAYKRLHGPLPADIVLPEVTLNKDPESPGPKYSDEASSCMPSPAISLLDSNISIKQEPLDTNTVSPMAMFEDLDSKPSPLPTLDVTQHSAEMLCDLPCPSSLRSVRRKKSMRLLPNSSSRTSSRQSLISQAYHAWWARLFLYHIHLQTLNACRLIMLSIWTISPSRMQALITRTMAHSTRIPSPTTPSSSTISSTPTPLRLLPSTQLLAQRNAATSRVLQQQHALTRASTRQSMSKEILRSSRVVVSEAASDRSDAVPYDQHAVQNVPSPHQKHSRGTGVQDGSQSS